MKAWVSVLPKPHPYIFITLQLVHESYLVAIDSYLQGTHTTDAMHMLLDHMLLRSYAARSYAARSYAARSYAPRPCGRRKVAWE